MQVQSIHASPKLIRLNKRISNAGVCARRKADELIAAGHIAVDGVVVRNVGVRVAADAIVTYKGMVLQAERCQYILLNKPKGYITTTQDPEGRKIVIDLISKRYCKDRLYPVGRLDCQTTGLLLLTNDGVLAQQLAHPSSKVEKLYHVMLNKPLHPNDFEHILQGVHLEDGVVEVDKLAMVDGDPSQLDIALHMGKNRIIRRLFEHLGYSVDALDRIGYAHLTKKNIPRGKWISLKHYDVAKLKQLAKPSDPSSLLLLDQAKSSIKIKRAVKR